MLNNSPSSTAVATTGSPSSEIGKELASPFFPSTHQPPGSSNSSASRHVRRRSSGSSAGQRHSLPRTPFDLLGPAPEAPPRSHDYPAAAHVHYDSWYQPQPQHQPHQPPTTPPPPSPNKSSSAVNRFSEKELAKLLSVAAIMKTELNIGEKLYDGRRYSNVFVGSEVCAVIVARNGLLVHVDPGIISPLCENCNLQLSPNTIANSRRPVRQSGIRNRGPEQAWA